MDVFLVSDSSMAEEAENNRFITAHSKLTEKASVQEKSVKAYGIRGVELRCASEATRPEAECSGVESNMECQLARSFEMKDSLKKKLE